MVRLGNGTPWFRLWDEMVDDPKLLRHSTNVRWVWLCIMTLANRSPLRGRLYISENEPCSIEDIVRISRESAEVVSEAVRVFESKRYAMLGKDRKGAWVVRNWERRQPGNNDSSNSLRQKRFRERQKALRNASRNATDTDTDKEKEEEALRLLDWVRWYESKFVIYPSGREFNDFAKLQAAGVTDDLIIAVLEDSLREEGIDRPLLWAKRRISDMLPRGVKTKEDYEKRKAAKAQQQDEAQKPAPSAAPKMPSAEPEEDEVTRRLRELARRDHNSIQ